MMMTCISLVVILTGTTVTIRRRLLYHWIGASMQDLRKIGTFCSHMGQISAEYTGLGAGCLFGSRPPRSVSHPVNNVTQPQRNPSYFLGVKCAVIKQMSDLSQDIQPSAMDTAKLTEFARMWRVILISLWLLGGTFVSCTALLADNANSQLKDPRKNWLQHPFTSFTSSSRPEAMGSNKTSMVLEPVSG